MPRHLAEADLALFASGDVGLWKYGAVCLHIARCEDCRARVEVYRQARQVLKQTAAEMPAGVNWDRLAAEMTANIRVGLAAGECVAPRRRAPATFGWKPAAVATGVVGILSAAWWLNLPSSDADSLGRVVRTLVHGRGPASEGRGTASQEAAQGAVLQASADGIEAKENGVAVSVPQGASRPVSITVSAQGSASARYVDDAGQMTITSVYVQ